MAGYQRNRAITREQGQRGIDDALLRVPIDMHWIVGISRHQILLHAARCVEDQRVQVIGSTVVAPGKSAARLLPGLYRRSERARAGPPAQLLLPLSAHAPLYCDSSLRHRSHVARVASNQRYAAHLLPGGCMRVVVR